MDRGSMKNHGSRGKGRVRRDMDFPSSTSIRDEARSGIGSSIGLILAKVSIGAENWLGLNVARIGRACSKGRPYGPGGVALAACFGGAIRNRGKRPGAIVWSFSRSPPADGSGEQAHHTMWALSRTAKQPEKIIIGIRGLQKKAMVEGVGFEPT